LTFDQFPSIPNRTPRRLSQPLFILLLTLAGFAVMGYHPGLEDDGIYLSAVKAGLNPALYPHDADFFRLQLQATVFDRFIAAFVRFTYIPVSWAELLWQFLSLYAILWAAHSIAQRLFPERRAQWAAVALLSAMFTLPVAGTALTLADQHLHPRNIATALILAAVDRTLAGRRSTAFVLLALALVIHPIMAAFGISFCFFFVLVLTDSMYSRLAAPFAHAPKAYLLAALPLSWIFDPPTPAWRRALATRTYYFLYEWTWYEWLGAIGPLVLFWILWRWKSAEENPSPAFGGGETNILGCHPERSAGGAESKNLRLPLRPPLPPRFALALLLYGAFQQVVAMILLAPSALIRLTPLQPMRYLHLEYAFLVMIGGGLLGRHVLGRTPWRWALFLLAANGGMFASQRLLLPASEHLELPGRVSRNAWLQAFTWVRENTPVNAYFALDPEYLARLGEDYHSFRALAERSQLADARKDAAVVTQVPELAPRWTEQMDAQAGWRRFRIEDFQRLRARFGIDWVLVSYPPPARLTCIWHNDLLAVCRLPAGAPAPSP
jgi:hypothetical protein